MDSVTLRFPHDAKIVVIGGHWYRDDRNAIIATYMRGVPRFKNGWTLDELETCLRILEASEQCRLSRQKEDDVVEQAMGRFGARSPEAF